MAKTWSKCMFELPNIDFNSMFTFFSCAWQNVEEKMEISARLLPNMQNYYLLDALHRANYVYIRIHTRGCNPEFCGLEIKKLYNWATKHPNGKNETFEVKCGHCLHNMPYYAVSNKARSSWLGQILRDDWITKCGWIFGSFPKIHPICVIQSSLTFTGFFYRAPKILCLL